MKPRIRSAAKNYGTSEFSKQKEKNNKEITILKAPFVQNLKMGALDYLIEKANFGKVTKNIDGKFSRQIQKQLNEFDKKMLLESVEKQRLSSMETREFFVTSYITPQPMVKLFKQIEVEKKKMKAIKFEKERKNLDKLRERIMAKWSVIIFGYFYENAEAAEGKIKPEYHLNVDERTGEAIKMDEGKGDDDRRGNWLNFEKTASSTFDVQIRTMDKVVKEIRNKFAKNASAIVTVLGDALASPHFHTGSGMSSGRMGVAFLVENIKLLNSGQIEGKEEFMEMLEEKFELVKENVVEWARKFIEILPENEETAESKL